MPRPVSHQPTDVELQILRILWDLGPSPVRDIHARLTADKGTSYSTTVKMLAIMLDKQWVTRDESVAPHVYRATLSRAQAGKRIVGDLISKLYDGAAMSLVLQALGSARATPDEIAQARRLLDRLEEKSS